MSKWLMGLIVAGSLSVVALPAFACCGSCDHGEEGEETAHTEKEKSCDHHEGGECDCKKGEKSESDEKES